MPCSACKNEARCDSAGLCQIYRQELPAPSCWCQATGDEPHAKCCPLHESRPGAEEARAAMRAAAGVTGMEQMRGGQPASYWRDEALEQAAQIAERYSADPWVARDIRAMKGTTGVGVPDDR